MAGAITELAVGEALVSFLDDKGRPCVTERVFVLPPGSQIGPITADQRKALIDGSLVAGVYEKTVDRESAYEKLKGRAAASGARRRRADARWPTRPTRAARGDPSAPQPHSPTRRRHVRRPEGRAVRHHRPARRPPRGPGRVGGAHRPCARIGSSVGREIMRGVLGGILGGSRKR